MSVAVVVVNYGQWGHTRKCLDSLKHDAASGVSVILVDNGFPEPVPDWVGKLHWMKFERLESNTGFAGGNNRGFSISSEIGKFDHVLFLNNDAIVLPGTIKKLADHLDGNSKVGIVAPAIYRASNPRRLWSAGGRLLRWKMRFEQVDLPRDGEETGQAVEVDFVSGCALMIRSDLFERLHGFREDFFMYYEDADLCHRVREQGFRVDVLPGIRVLHEVASSSGGELSKLAIYFSDRNRIVLSRDILSRFMRSVFLIYKTAANVVITAKFLLWQGPALIPWLWRGYFHGLMGRTGYREMIGRLT